MSQYLLTFSPTGGTKKVAGAVAAGFEGDFIEIDLLKQGSFADLELTSNDLCIVATPAYGGRVSGVCVDRLKTLRGAGAQAVCVAVYGNRHIDDTLVELQDLLTDAGFRCVAGVAGVAAHSLVYQFAAGRPNEADRAELADFGRKIKAAMETGTLSGDLTLPGGRPYKEFGGVAFKPTVNNHCHICGLCPRECPVGAIPVLEPTTTKDNCIACMRCVSLCPYGARELDRAIGDGLYEKMKAICTEPKPNKLYL